MWSSLAERFRPDARAWLAAAALVGLGQQLFVVLRNPYLQDLGLSSQAIGLVQGAGGIAGVAAALVGFRALPRWPSRVALSAGVLANALGFALQVFARSTPAFVLGAAVAGSGIQFLTMASAPFLQRTAAPAERARLFSTQAIALQSLPGALGAALGGQLQGAARDALGSPAAGARVALAAGAVAVALALVPLRTVREAPPADAAPASLAAHLRLRHPRRAAALLAPDVLIFLGSGLTVPFLQLYFKRAFGLGGEAVGALYAGTMLAGGVGHLVAPRLAARFGAWRVVLAAQLLALPLFAELVVAGSVPLAAGAFALRHTLMTLAGPLYSSFLHAHVAPEDGPAVASYRMLAQSLAWALANVAAGPLLALDGGGFRYVLGATMAIYAAAAVVGARVYPRAAAAAESRP